MTAEVKLCVEILDKAIDFEETGIAFFKERAENAPSQLERNLFQSLATDEAGHRAHLMKMKEDLLRTENPEAMAPDAESEHRSAREVFEAAMAEVTDPYQADDEQLEIIKGAMEVERKGHAMYSAAVAEVESERAKSIFQHLAEEEQHHFALLKNTHDYLADPESWHGFDEGSMLDGG